MTMLLLEGAKIVIFGTIFFDTLLGFRKVIVVIVLLFQLIYDEVY